MGFTTDLPGGWYDLPDSLWAAGNLVIEDHLVALNSLVRFAAVCDEYIAASAQKAGGTIPLPQSVDDGYAYSRSEALYAYANQASPNPATGTNSGQGNVLFVDEEVAQDTGVVSTVVNYYVQGGQETATTDGLVAVLVCCRRGAGNPAAVAIGTGGGSAGGGGGTQTGGAGGGDQGVQGPGDYGPSNPRPVF